MPTLNFEQLFEVASTVLQGAGVSEAEAAIIGAELADSNMVGHDSHGIMRLMQYVDLIRDGHAKPGARMEIVNEGSTYAVIDGRFNFGQVVARAGLQLGLDKARDQGSATILIRNCNHVGRLGAYTHEAARAGMVALMAVNAPGPGGVAPFGGMERRLGTNPLSIAAPAGSDALVLDMTTSATAEGKLRVSMQKGEMVPPGLMIDGHGNPSCDPRDYYAKPLGSILPLGSPLMGHKGFGLSVMIDVLCGILSGSGVCRDDLPRGANGVWLHLLQIETFLPRDAYDEWMEVYIASLKGCPRLPGVDEILLPGEIEQRRRQQRQQTGVEIPPETWRQICALADTLNVSLAVACPPQLD